MQEGGLGNLIALPLQYHARQKGNNLFLDPDNAYIPFRKDKLQKLMFFYMGEIIYRIDPDKISSELKGVDSILEIRHTDFYPTFEKVKKYNKIIEALTEDENRNTLNKV